LKEEKKNFQNKEEREFLDEEYTKIIEDKI
jgi:hypothetical protein